jgi:hypothetical protein
VSKYHSIKTIVDGIEFDSKREAQRYQQLKLMVKAGVICNLNMQVKYELVPAQYIDGKCVERAVSYVSDFEYDENGKHIVEDTKGMRTKEYIIKRKLMLHKYGIRIREI